MSSPPGRRGSLGLAVAIAGAACVARSRPTPLPDLTGISRVVVTPFGGSMYEFRPRTDSLRIARLINTLRLHQTGWREPWHTLPNPDLGVVFMRDSTVVGVLWIGREFIAAFSPRSERLLKRVTSSEEIALRALVDSSTFIGSIQPPHRDPPQNEPLQLPSATFEDAIAVRRM